MRSNNFQVRGMYSTCMRKLYFTNSEREIFNELTFDETAIQYETNLVIDKDSDCK